MNERSGCSFSSSSELDAAVNKFIFAAFFLRVKKKKVKRKENEALFFSLPSLFLCNLASDLSLPPSLS